MPKVGGFSFNCFPWRLFIFIKCLTDRVCSIQLVAIAWKLFYYFAKHTLHQGWHIWIKHFTFSFISCAMFFFSFLYTLTTVVTDSWTLDSRLIMKSRIFHDAPIKIHHIHRFFGVQSACICQSQRIHVQLYGKRLY